MVDSQLFRQNRSAAKVLQNNDGFDTRQFGKFPNGFVKFPRALEVIEKSWKSFTAPNIRQKRKNSTTLLPGKPPNCRVELC